MEDKEAKMNAYSRRILLFTYFNDGKSPINMMREASKLLTDNEASGLDSKQRIVMQKIGNYANTVSENWNKLVDSFYDFQAGQPLSVEDLNDNKILLLQKNFMQPALSSLYLIKEQTMILLQGQIGHISDEDRELLEVMYRCSLNAIKIANDLQNYFNEFNGL